LRKKNETASGFVLQTSRAAPVGYIIEFKLEIYFPFAVSGNFESHNMKDKHTN
jgi:hypothetical protein